MRLAVLINLAPRKLGSLEAWLIELCREARARHHRVDLYAREPAHAGFRAGVHEQRAQLFTLGELEQRPARALVRLAGYDVLHLNLLTPRSKVALLAYAAWPARVLYVAHSDYPFDAQAGLVRRLSRRVLDKLSLRRAEGLAGVSSYIRDKERHRFGLARSRTRTLYLGVDSERFRPRPPRRHQGVVLLGAAYLIRNKGFDHLLRALARMNRPGLTLRIAGDGPELPALTRLVEQLRLGAQVELLGLRDDLPELLWAADLFVHPTLVDAFGLAVAEAMAAGRPVVASRVGGLPELVRHGQTGLLVAPGDEGELARAIEQLADDRARRESFGRAASERVRTHFEVHSSVARHLDWCEQAQSSSRHNG